MLSQKTRYALKALLEIASLPADATLSSAAIAKRCNIPLKFLEAILAELRRNGLLHVRRGRSGGYRLAQKLGTVSFGDIIRMTEGPLALLPCVSRSQFRRCGDCDKHRSCELKDLFSEVRDGTARILDEWTLADALARSGLRVSRPAASGDRARRRPGARRSLRRTAARE